MPKVKPLPIDKFKSSLCRPCTDHFLAELENQEKRLLVKSMQVCRNAVRGTNVQPLAYVVKGEETMSER